MCYCLPKMGGSMDMQQRVSRIPFIVILILLHASATLAGVGPFGNIYAAAYEPLETFAPWVLTLDGEVYSLQDNGTGEYVWEREMWRDIPNPSDQVALWFPPHYWLRVDGHMMVYGGVDMGEDPPEPIWIDAGAPGSTPVRESSWSQLKGSYKE